MNLDVDFYLQLALSLIDNRASSLTIVGFSAFNNQKAARMPDVHFVGEIKYAVIDNYSHISVTYAFVPGSSAWFLKAGKSFGETHTTAATEQDDLTFNYPLDAHFDTSSAEGWPFFVCEVSFTHNQNSKIVKYMLRTTAMISADTKKSFHSNTYRCGINRVMGREISSAVVAHGSPSRALIILLMCSFGDLVQWVSQLSQVRCNSSSSPIQSSIPEFCNRRQASYPPKIAFQYSSFEILIFLTY